MESSQPGPADARLRLQAASRASETASGRSIGKEPCRMHACARLERDSRHEVHLHPISLEKPSVLHRMRDAHAEAVGRIPREHTKVEVQLRAHRSDVDANVLARKTLDLTVRPAWWKLPGLMLPALRG